MKCWMNGDYMEAEELRISPFDHGFLYGVGFFETFRTYQGQVLLFREHMNRLRAALHEYRITLPYTDEDILSIVRKLDELAGHEDGYFRLNISAGVHDIGLAPKDYPEPNVILFRKKLVSTIRGTEKAGQWLETSRNQPESSIRHKSHGYLNNVRGRLEMTSLKETEGLFLTPEGFVAEGVTSNIFWIKHNVLYTPAISTGIVPGITRSYVMGLALQAGLQVREVFHRKEEVECADEVFVTNAVQELVPLSAIGNMSLPGNTGTWYKNLHALYVQAIERLKVGVQG